MKKSNSVNDGAAPIIDQIRELERKIQLLDQIIESVRRHKGGLPLEDDMLLIGFRYSSGRHPGSGNISMS